MVRVMRKIGKGDPATVSLPKMLFQPGYARNRAQKDELSGYDGEVVLQGSAEGDQLSDFHDPETLWIDGVPRDRTTGALVVQIGGEGPSPRLPTDIEALNREDPEPRFSDGRLKTDIGAMLDHPMNDAVVDTRQWPVPGDGRPARRNEIGPNGRPYSDGRYSSTGAYRRTIAGLPRPHRGIDLPAAIGAPVDAADDGVVISRPNDPDGYGCYTEVAHGDGTRSLYAHLQCDTRLPVGERVVQGQEVGNVGVTGNVGARGSHLHLGVRDRNGNYIDPTRWVNERTIAR